METPQLKMNRVISVMNLSGEKNLHGENIMAQNTAPNNANQADDKETKPKVTVTTENATPKNPKAAKEEKTNPGKNVTTENATFGDNSVGERKAKLSEMAKTRKPKHPPTSEMVLNSIKSLKMRKGATLGAIYRHMEDKYQVNVEKLKRYITRYFDDAVEKGILVKSGTAEDSRFKLQKAENAAVKKTLDPKKVLKQDKIEKKIKMTENAKKRALEPKAVLKKDKIEKKVKKTDGVKKTGRNLKDAKKTDKKEKRTVGRPKKQ